MVSLGADDVKVPFSPFSPIHYKLYLHVFLPCMVLVADKLRFSTIFLRIASNLVSHNLISNINKKTDIWALAGHYKNVV